MNKNGGVFFGPMSLNNNALIGIPSPQYDYSAANKTYVDTEINKVKQNISSSGDFVKKSGDTMTGDLILPDYDYPIMGDLRKDIDYETMREIFLSKKEGGTMEQALDMSNHHIENVRTPLSIDHAANKLYAKAAKRVSRSGGTMTGDINMGVNKITNLATPKTYKNEAAINVSFFNTEINESNSNLFTQITKGL